MTIDSSSELKKPKCIFWESLTGQRFELSDPRIHRFYRTIAKIFNDKASYINIQPDDRVISTIYDLEDDTLWTEKKSKATDIEYSPYQTSLMQNTTDVYEEQRVLERLLKERIVGYRASEIQSNTTWDNQLGYLLNQALLSYELQRISNQKFSEDEFKSSIQNYVPVGNTFKAFPIQFNHYDADKMIIAISKSQGRT